MNKHSFTTWVRPLVALLLLATGTFSAKASLWLLGDLTGNGWHSNSGTEFTPIDANNYTLDVNITSTNTDLFFSLTTQLSSSENQWNDIKQYRFGGENIKVTLDSDTQLYANTDKSPSVNVDEAGYYKITFNTSTKKVRISKIWYVKGQWNGASSWNTAEAMTNTSGSTWTLTKAITAGTASYFLLSTQQLGQNDWSPRYHYDSSNKDVSAGGTFNVTKQSGDGSYYIPAASAITGTYTFTFDASTNQLMVTVPTVSTSSATLYIYSETEPTMSGVTFTQEANDNSDYTKDGLFYWYKGVYSNTTWSGNVSFTANGSTKTLALGTDLVNGGTYYFDATNTATTADYNPYANKTITIYVRSTDFPNAKLHAWYTPVDKTYSDANNIAINGTYGDASQAMTGDVEINGYHWFKKEFTGYNAIYAMLSGGDKGASGMFTAQGSPFDGTLYYYIDARKKWRARTTAPVNPNTGEMYLIGLAAPEGQKLTNEWAANVGIKMTKVTDSNGTYFKADNVKLMSLNSGFAFATSLANSADDWETLNDCRYGAVVVNDGDTQKILYHSMIQYGTAGNDDDPTHWHQMYEVGQSENTFTVESTDVYNIIIFPAHGSEPTKVHLHTATELKDVMYILTGTPTDNGTKANFDLRTPVQMTHDSDNDVFTAEVSFSPGTLLTFSRDLLDWTLINSSRIGAPANTGDEGYWITNDNLKTQITGLQSEQVSWSDKNNNNFCIKTNKSGLFKVTLSTTESWVKFEQLWVSKGDKVHVYLEKVDDINPNPLISAYDKESWANHQGQIHVDRPNLKVLIGSDPNHTGDNGTERYRLCLVKNQAPATELHTTADGRTWYSWELNHTIADFILTKNGKLIDNVVEGTDGDTNDTDATKIQWRKSGEIYLHWENGQLTDYTRDYDESAAQEAPVVTKMLDGRYYCYFINTAKWPQSYIHAWVTNAQGENVDLLGTYPGKKMTDLVGYDDAGNEVWLFDFGSITSMEEPTGIIFSIGMKNGMQTGDYKFVNGAVYDYTGTVVLGRDLGNIIAKGVKDRETRYIIEDDIVAVYYDANEKALYCKDLNKYITIPGSVERSVQKDGEIDYARTTTNKLAGQMASDRYDQSNWIKLKVHEATGNEYYTTAYQSNLEDFARNRNVLKAGTVRGVLPNVKNPTMEIVKLDNGGTIQTNGTSTYASNVTKRGATLNVFTPAHFVGSQPGLVSGRNYFFVTPKPNEYARVTWAVCTKVEGNTATFRIPESKYQGGGEFDNEDKLKGGFTADLSKLPAGTNPPTVGQVYSFPAIITLNESSASPAPRRAPSSYNGGDAGTPAYDYVVYPLSLSDDDLTTDVTEVNTSKTVANVTYVNIAGMQSAEPFDGVNIVVTTYTDGTRSAVKVIK